jgi:outer membrane protein OmpA-like peptidoglycan-associated protein
MQNNQTNRLILFVLLVGLGWQTPVQAQDNRAASAQMVEIGDEILNQTNAVMEARDLYIAAVNMNGNNIRANYMAGLTTLRSIDKGAATPYFLKVYELDPNYSFDILYKIGLAYHYDYKFDDAIRFYERYADKVEAEGVPRADFASLEEVERKLYECEQGKIMLEFPEEVEIKNIGPEINSPDADYAPVVNAAEDILIFTSRRKQGNLNSDVSSDNFPYEDIYIATRTDSVWSDASNIGQPVNTLYHDSNVGLSKDGTTLYIYKDDNEGDIFESTRDASGNWTEPKSMGKPVNSEYSETTVSITPDGQVLFFASNRKGGYGDLDIWMTKKDRKGDWGEPVNLGDEINTKYDEDGPFIGYDGKTLYFSSEGGEGMGGFDIYRVVYDSASESWSAPQNMGYPINTPDHDIYFVPSTDGDAAFYSSVRDDGYGNSDIYMLTIPHTIGDHEDHGVKSPYVMLIVTVMNEAGEQIDVRLRMNQADGPEELFAARDGDGNYRFVNNPAEPRNYIMELAAAGYEEKQVEVSLPAITDEDQMINMTVSMKKKVETPPPPPPPPPVTTTSSKQLRNVYFLFNSAWLMPAHQDKVDKAVAYLKANPNSKLMLVGHSDLIGAERYNTGLSKRRAESIKKAIVAQGIAASRIQTKGEGSKYPLASNDDEKEGRELNRRVEFKVIK